MGYKNISVASFDSPTQGGVAGLNIGRVIFDSSTSGLYKKVAVSSANTITDALADNSLTSLFNSLKVDTLRGSSYDVPARVIDVSQADILAVTLTSGVNALSLSNVPTTESTSFILEVNNVTGSTISWWSNIKWPGGTIPAPTLSGLDVYAFYSKDGITWRGSLAHKDSK